MKIRIRQFNELGLKMFAEYIAQIRSKERDRIPYDFITNNEFSIELADDINVEINTFEKREDLIKYLYPKIKTINITNLYYRSSLWSWLSAAYFDSICPQHEDGSRTIYANERYILNTGQWNRYYRHLIASPLRLYHEIGNDELSKFYLYGKPNIFGDIFEQLASRQEFATVAGIIEAALLLYWDYENDRPKLGSTNRNKKGNIRRFVSSILPQFEMTYDINSMNGEDILKLLPQEFEDWK
ncbi:MAG: hypothetical protein SVU94_08085 [Bacteroidota bacterium]|nr:hypothetical protein [Bacteroidota bacterium]